MRTMKRKLAVAVIAVAAVILIFAPHAQAEERQANTTVPGSGRGERPDTAANAKRPIPLLGASADLAITKTDGVDNGDTRRLGDLHHHRQQRRPEQRHRRHGGRHLPGVAHLHLDLRRRGRRHLHGLRLRQHQRHGQPAGRRQRHLHGELHRLQPRPPARSATPRRSRRRPA